MNLNRYTNLVEATNDLNQRGFTASFQFEDGKMICSDNETEYAPEDMSIKEFHRFEGYSNPGDSSIIYAVMCKDGNKGMVVTSYGADASSDIEGFMKKVEVDSKEKDVNIEARTPDTPRK